MKGFADELRDFVGRRLALVNLVAAFCCVASYEVTMYLCVYWTSWKDSAGAYGGVLDYRFLGISTIFHVTGQNVQGQALFAFPDITPYLLIAIIILNLLAILANWKKSFRSPSKDVMVANIVLGVLCILAYAWGTMLYIAHLLNDVPNTPSPGGILYYTPFLGFYVYHVSSGALESIGVGGSFLFGDIPLLLLIVIIVLNLAGALRTLFTLHNVCLTI